MAFAVRPRSLASGIPLVALLALTACDRPGTESGLVAEACHADFTPISTIQGDGWASPLEGERVRVLAQVTHIEEAGTWLQSITPDNRPETSEGLYMPGQRLAREMQLGSVIAVSGTVTELHDTRDTLTSLTGVETYAACEGPGDLPLDEASLPLDAEAREAREGMRLRFAQFLTVTDVYRLGRGDLAASLDGQLPSPTEVARPGEEARRQMRLNRERVLPMRLAEPPDTFPVGTRLQQVEGVMGHDGRGARMLVADKPTMTRPPLFDVPAADPDTVRVVALNLQNYFNGDGRGGGFPTERGAESPQEFRQQRERLRAALAELAPDILAVMEMENDGFEPGSAAWDVLEDLQAATGEDWALVPTEEGATGSDQIQVGLFWRLSAAQPVGQPATLQSQPFLDRSRPPLAMAFRSTQGGVPFLVVVNHLKSKGSCPEGGADANRGDGQGCWNPERTRAAKDMINWARSESQRAAGGHALVLGDMNAYRMEDPIQAIIQAGFDDLTAPAGAGFEYSYVYFGEAGTLDHAFATPNLTRLVHRAEILNINAGWPRSHDLEPAWLGSSDHDPVVVDIRTRQPSTTD